MVQSVLGTASLDGAWTFGCSDPDFDEGGINYEQEFLIYQGDSVESRVYLYAPDDTNCSGGIVGVNSEGPFDIEIINEPEDALVLIEAWLGEDENENDLILNPPPERQVGGLLPAGNQFGEPFFASVEIFIIPGEQSEEGCVYIDDSDQTQNGLNWYLYRCVGDDFGYEPFLDSLEPLIKAELPVVGVIPVPAGIWLFGTALIGFIGYSRRRKIS
jgi:hypothetical protein